MAFKIANITASGNILQWNSESIAINKINSIELYYSHRKFPWLTLLTIIIGIICCLNSHFFWGLLLIILGGAYMHWWSSHRYYNYRLNLKTSSAEPFVIPFGDNNSMANEVHHAILNEMDQIK